MSATKILTPMNHGTAGLIKFVPHFKQLKIGWTACAPRSEGVEQFVEEYLPVIRENNPDVKFSLYRTHTLIDPFLKGLYNFNRERNRRLVWKTAEQVLAQVEEMALGGDFRPGRKRGVNKRLPRGLEIWDSETKGHDVFEVYSKWKADPAPEGTIKSMQHPNLVHKPH
ncbi:unnamed protein product [Bursaphelenchus okinawaensis]|uniref:L51_S25_CI-B8 domain-containing protein n=1 Tax=Bursaphelenchus okinawaensis TaxID=465554 RepID=A0A811K7W5_9BILA|nr:unnamed protein product [Bursaphelenchus okinawaensis]CAG9093570.1 unnamed protein product [Bursaphelenchus okinawaensis]